MEAIIQEAEERLARQRQDAAQAKATMAQAMVDLQRAQDALLSRKLDTAIFAQRRVEEEAQLFTKSVHTLYQRSAKWKSEQKRFRTSLHGLDKFENWATTVEKDLHGIAGNLEYVCSVLERENTNSSSGSNPPQ